MDGARPRIGIARWEDVPHERLADYWDRMKEAGGEVVDLHDPNVAIPDIDALMLTGGIDADPALYGEERHAKVRHVDPARDAFELAILRSALARDIPVLAICRGHQLLNVAFGGGLLQHIEGDSHRALGGVLSPSRWHTVRFEAGSRLRDLYGDGDIEVNSRHHQAVTPETLASGLTPLAMSPDGLIEAVESRAHRWVFGVQWHPERLEPEHPAFRERHRPLSEAFVAEAAKVGPRV